MTPESFRKRFPIFEDKIFLNSCSKGALSTAVEQGYDRYLESWRRQGSPWEDWVEILEEVRSLCARFIGCDSNELAVSFCASSATAGLLSALSYEGERNRILVDDFEFPTMAHNFLAQERRGAAITRVRKRDEELPPESYESVLDERVLLAPMAHICFRNGYRQDVDAVVKMAQRVGAWTLVDDYQCTGTRPIDVKALGCDFLVTGALKYLLGSSGLGFMYVREDRLEALEPVITGWFGQSKPFDFDIERATHHASARRFETGTPPVPNLYAGRAGLETLAELSPQAVSDHVDGLMTRLIRGARERGVRVLTPESPEHRGPLVVLAATDADRAVELLGRHDIIVSARGSGIRVSAHYYNLLEDIDALWSVLDRSPDLLEKESRSA